jgi:DNA modification methylase
VSASAAANSLYFGDNLEILRSEIRSESVDLIYLDPPFNSKANYNLLFRSPNGHEPHAQITAFEDTWHWGEQAEREFAELVQQPNTDVSEMMQALRRFLGENDVMAYLTMMANRLLELHRVLKPTGSLYLHCDPTASHYLKIVLDGIFGKENFQNEVVWKRTTTKNDYAQGAVNWPRVHDLLLYYTKDRDQRPSFHQPFEDYSEGYVDSKYPYTDQDGRRYGLWDLTAPGSGSRGHPQYELMGVTRYWRYGKEKMAELVKQGRVIQPRPGAVPRYKRLLDEMQGVAMGDVWTDTPPINSQAQERLGYPTQKPVTLLERVIQASSNEGDIILDPFCGCGTAIHAAEKLKRRWIGIDITHLAISLVESRLRAAFPGITFDVHGVPKDLDSARDLAQRDKYEFQYWACSLVKARPYQGKKKGADTGIDGVIPFQDDKTFKKIIVSVKAGENVSVAMIRDLGHVVNREKASHGFFITLAKPTAPMRVEAVKAGYYQSPVGPKPKIQILTIEGLLAGTEKPEYFDLSQGGLMSRKPKRELDAIQLGFPESAAYLSEVQTTEETEEPRRKDARVARAAKPRRLTKKTA